MRPVILFDLDGTVIDSTEAILDGFRVAFSSFNEPIPSDEIIKSHIGKTLHDMFRLMGVEDSLIDKHVYAYKMHYRTIHLKKTKLLPNAKEAIDRANRFATLGVVTTKTGKYSIEILEHLGIMNYFDTLVGFEHITNPKPHAEPILKALSNLKVRDKDRVYMIGDTPMDIISSINAGVNPIAVTSGYASYEALKKYTSQIHNNVFEAIEYISILNQKPHPVSP